MTSLGDIQQALSPMSDLLAADGYGLSVTTGTEGAARLTVTAGPDACADCLVPKDTFVAIAVKHLRDRGLPGGVEITYPEEASSP